MRTTITVDRELLKDAKRRATETGKTLTAVIEDALRESLSRRRNTRPAKRPRLRTVAGDGLRPGVDLDDSADLLDRMERPS
jgi:hypothetical protein